MSTGVPKVKKLSIRTNKMIKKKKAYENYLEGQTNMMCE